MPLPRRKSSWFPVKFLIQRRVCLCELFNLPLLWQPGRQRESHSEHSSPAQQAASLCGQESYCCLLGPRAQGWPIRRRFQFMGCSSYSLYSKQVTAGLSSWMGLLCLAGLVCDHSHGHSFPASSWTLEFHCMCSLSS